VGRHDTGPIDLTTPTPADDRALDQLAGRTLAPPIAPSGDAAGGAGAGTGAEPSARPDRRRDAVDRLPWGRPSDHLMPASIVQGAPLAGGRTARRGRRARPSASPLDTPVISRRRLVVLAAGLVVAAWVAGLAGALAGNEVAARRDEPPRRPSTLGLVVASPRDVEPPSIDVAAVASEIGVSVVAIHRSGASGGDSSGTGLIVTADGEIVTNAHVVGDATTVDVRLPGERDPRVGAVIAVDPANDLALVRIQADGLVPAVFAAPTDVRVGDEVVAVGYALDLDGDPSVTRGVVSALDRSLTTRSGVLNGLVQTDAAISSGNSGGPLVDAFGRVVGINTAVAYGDVDTAANSLGFAIGVAELMPELTDLRTMASGTPVRRGYLGVGLAPRRDGGRGAVVTQVEEDSPADLAGLLTDDVVVILDGRDVLGDGVQLELSVVLGTRAEPTDP
jgi:putative serine protease PepD